MEGILTRHLTHICRRLRASQMKTEEIWRKFLFEVARKMALVSEWCIADGEDHFSYLSHLLSYLSHLFTRSHAHEGKEKWFKGHCFRHADIRFISQRRRKDDGDDDDHDSEHKKGRTEELPTIFNFFFSLVLFAFFSRFSYVWLPMLPALSFF